MKAADFAILKWACLVMLMTSVGITSTSSTPDRSGSYGNGAWVPLKKLSSDQIILPSRFSGQFISIS